MRIRITKCEAGVIDGISLDAFVVGQVYDVPLGLGSYLVMNRCAEVVDAPAETRVSVVPAAPLDIAADAKGKPKQ